MLVVVEEMFLHQKGLLLDALRTMENGAAANTSTVLRKTCSHALCYSAYSYLNFQANMRSGHSSEIYSIHSLERTPPQRQWKNYITSKSCFKGETIHLIRNLLIINENYECAWKALIDYYENKRLLVRSYIFQFISQKLKGEFRSGIMYISLRGEYRRHFREHRTAN